MSKFSTAKQFINQIFGGAQKTTGTEVISSVNIGKNLTKKKTIKDDLIKSRDKHFAGVRDEAKVEIKSKNPLSKFTKKIENIVDKKAKGGRVGLKFGSKKSNVQKIKETFGPKKKLSTKQMKIAKQAGDPNKIEGVDFKKLQQKRKV